MELAVWIISIAYIWLLAAAFNPNVDSGVVWMVAFIYANIMSTLKED